MLVLSVCLSLVLLQFGRKIFWPLIPKPGAHSNTNPAKVSFWRGLAEGVSKRPVRSLAAGLALLAVMTTGLIGTSVGLQQAEKFRVQSESAEGLETLSAHFPPGEAAPIFIIGNTAATDEIIATVKDIDGIVRAHKLDVNDDGSLTAIMVTSDFAPSSDESFAQVQELRSILEDVSGADALVGGSSATDLDAKVGNENDLLLIAPLVLAVCFLVLVFLLRSLLAPIVLLAINLFSAVAAIGAGAWLSRLVFEQQSLDPQVPILAFLFLVALGIDYTIFLVHRTRTEAKILGTRAGVVEAVAHTGSVITSAGIVLAAVFAALGVLPLVVLGQLGLIVGLGVIVDTLVVRGIIVPAIFNIFGEKIWCPQGAKK